MSKAVEIPPDDMESHRCEVRKKSLLREGDEMYRAPGTLWQCPDCKTWWKSVWFDASGIFTEWSRVIEGTKDWKRIEAHNNPFTVSGKCLHERTHNSGFLGLGRAQRCLDCGADLR